MVKKRTFDVGIDIYSRQSWESDDEWHAYQAYRDLFGDRDFGQLRQVLGNPLKAPRYFEKLAKLNLWDERNLEADRYRDRELIKREIDEVSDMRKRHLRISHDLQDLAHAQLCRYNDMLKKLTEQGAMGLQQAASFFKPRDVIAWLEVGTKLERLNLDQPGAIDEMRGPSIEEQHLKMRELLQNAKVRKAMGEITKELK